MPSNNEPPTPTDSNPEPVGARFLVAFETLSHEYVLSECDLSRRPKNAMIGLQQWHMRVVRRRVSIARVLLCKRLCIKVGTLGVGYDSGSRMGFCARKLTSASHDRPRRHATVKPKQGKPILTSWRDTIYSPVAFIDPSRLQFLRMQCWPRFSRVMLAKHLNIPAASLWLHSS
jgi:hypothetical protein